MKKSISVIAACVGAPLLAAGIAVPSASADPTNNPSPPPRPISLRRGLTGMLWLRCRLSRFRSRRDLEADRAKSRKPGCAPSKPLAAEPLKPAGQPASCHLSPGPSGALMLPSIRPSA